MAEDQGKDEGLQQLLDGIKQLGSVVQQQAESITKLQEGQAQFQSSMLELQKGNQTEPQDKRPSLTEAQLEELPRAEFMNHMMQQFSGVLDEKLKGVATSAEEAQSAARLVDAKQRVKEVMQANPDFNDFREEIKARIEATPGIDVEDALVLARAADPAKAKELGEKYKMPGYDKPDDKGGDDKTGKQDGTDDKPPYGGSTSESNGDGGSGDDKSAVMSTKDAAMKAYDDIMSDVDAAALGIT